MPRSPARTIALLLTCSLLGSASANANTDTSNAISVSLDSSQIATIQASVRNYLRNPDAANFGRIGAAADNEGTISVCGWIDVPNGAGAAIARSPYIGMFSSADNFDLVLIGSGRDMNNAIINTCKTYGINLKSTY